MAVPVAAIVGAGLAMSSAAGKNKGSVAQKILDPLGIFSDTQVEDQMKLNEQAAALNYKYGEMAAENAYKRQLAMYQRSYEDQSYGAMRKQMEDAGLSVGLMYGGSGSGGGQGEMSGAPQAETGGAMAGAAPTREQRLQTAMQLSQLALTMQNMKAEVSVKESAAKKNEADAEAARAKASLETEQKITEMQSREARIRDIYEVGKGRWIENLRMLYEDATEQGENDNLEADDMLYGEHSIIGKRMANKQVFEDLLVKQAKAAEARGNEQAAKALAALNTEKKKYLYKQIQIEAAKADAMGVMAKARELASEWQTGEYTNWKTWAELGIDGVEIILSIAQMVGGKKVRGQILNKMAKNNGGSLPKQFKDLEDIDGIPFAVD